jgi:predicted helicase
MSRLLVTQYQTEVEKIIQYGGSKKETSIRNAFERLLNDYCKPRNYLLIPELDFKTKFNTTVYPDGTIKDAIRLEHGWWESKDEYDKLDLEIEKKFEKGYPDENILFEDSQNAVLIQHSREIGRVSMRDAEELDRLLNIFVDYERPEVRDFRAAITKFKEDIPQILEKLRETIQFAEKENQQFRDRRNSFLEVCRQSINPEITIFDVHEMLIQHILTEDIFTNIFHESQFHRENNIARELSAMLDTFFTGNIRRNTLKSIEYYYAVIRRSSENIANHHEKQKFLKALYENFYKAYNPKAADRLGIVYTPNEIVRFMIESADHLVHKHFGKLLSDEGVEILDPCTGTGTYITELIEYLPPHKLEHKYQHEIHCNEMAILPYYIANLNIEFTYAQKMGKYEEFKNICLVDTLDHCGFEGKQFDLFAMSVQNTARIQNQNDRKISVIIGNPPYNANQENENDNNRNRVYEDIDSLIKNTYVHHSKAQKSKAYDMYSRFFCWATNRLSQNGILAFITNSSFVHKKTFDGFRKVVADQFSDIYIIDLGGNIRSGDKTGNIFGIKLGIAISFMIRKSTKSTKEPCKIFYCNMSGFENAEQKLKFLSQNQFIDFNFEHINPDKNYNWVDLTDNNFDQFIPVADKNNKKLDVDIQSIFKLFSLGCVTNRDEWLYDFSLDNLTQKIRFFCDVYEKEKTRWNNLEEKIKINDFVDRTIKWTSELESYFVRGEKLNFSQECIREGLYRPYSKHYLYYERVIVHRPYQTPSLFPQSSSENIVISFTDPNSEKPFASIATNRTPDLHLLGAGCGAQCLPLYRYDAKGDRIDNITDWGLTQFQTYYQDSKITKENIFHYTYAVLHHPHYRTKYELNLKREFPRLPFYQDFHQWTNWGKTLMELHLNYETIQPYGLQQVEIATKENPKVKLKADKINGVITLDENTQLIGINAIAWEYKLGNRSALEWILDQYKEKKPKDPTIAKLFNTYKFADYKEQVIDLLQRVCTVSVKTMEIIQQMP